MIEEPLPAFLVGPGRANLVRQLLDLLFDTRTGPKLCFQVLDPVFTRFIPSLQIFILGFQLCILGMQICTLGFEIVAFVEKCTERRRA